ncbi:MAG: hypothetical protein V2I33_24310 [Kangiellaceae bacterium]|nr:hypothetical protein [Kangiellaceae bacterium]
MNGASIIYPGGVSSPPAQKKMNLWFTSGVGGLEHDGTIAIQSKPFQLSLKLSLAEVNSNPNLLEKFVLKYHLTSFGIAKPSEIFIANQMKEAKPTLGLGIDNSGPDSIYMRMANIIKKLGI